MTAAPGVAVVAVLLAAAAGAVAPGDPARLLRRVSVSSGPARVERRRGRPPWWLPAPVLLVLAAVVSGSPLLGAAAGLSSLAVARSVSRNRSRRRAESRRVAALDLVTSLSAELRGGAESRAALAAVAGAWPAVAAAARSPAADPAVALGVAATAADGGGLLADLAAAWRVADTTGAALALPASRLAETARATEAVRRELGAQLAGPRATATLLSVLPGAGVLLGDALGADPVGFLVGSHAGRLCLLSGALLVAIGVGWTEAIVARAESP